MPIKKTDTPAFSFNQSLKEITITPPTEFSFKETLHYLKRSPAECMHFIEDDRVYKLLNLEEKLTVIEISETKEGRLQVHFVNRSPEKPETYHKIAGYIADWFDLSRDLQPFYQLVEEDPILGELTRTHFGLRIIGVPDLFEALCWAVIGQQVNLPFAYTVKKRFVEAYGKSYETNGQTFWLFPKPEDIMLVTVEDLKNLQFTGKKAEYIIGIAELMASGTLTKENLLKDLPQAERKLLSIRGIGPWSTHYVMMRCLRDPSAFPIGDAGLQNALKKLLGQQKKPAPEEMRRLFTPWKGWEAYAVFYLWRSLSS